MKNTTRKQFVRSFFASPHCNPGSPPAPAEPPLYAVIRLDEVCIFGTGNTLEMATEQARRWLPQNRALDVLPEFPLLGRVDGAEGLYMARCTPAVSKIVEAKGGASWLRFTVADNGALDVPPADSGAMDRFEEGLERLRQQVETDNAEIFGKRELMRNQAAKEEKNAIIRRTIDGTLDHSN